MLWATTVPLKSLLGRVSLGRLSLRADKRIWKDSFCGRRVLIVGSGPSVDQVDKEYFRSFDAIIFLNHAIKFCESYETSFFFSTDIKVVKIICREVYGKIFGCLGRDRCILAPIFFQQVVGLSKRFSASFSWIGPGRTGVKVHLSSSLFLNVFRVPVTAYLSPKQPLMRDLEDWDCAKDQVLAFPVMEDSSALSAVLFASKYKPSSVYLIGCDFSAGRSALLSAHDPAHASNPFERASAKFEEVKAFCNDLGVPVVNESYRYIHAR
jgi:hypothetical protein